MRTLRRGDTGRDVRTLQTALIRAGYDPGAVDGVFGYNTERAVKQFQRVLGLEEDGIVGSRTWSFLTPFVYERDPDVLRRGSRGEMVTTLQNALRRARYNVGEVDGLFGTRTQSAVRSFQDDNNLPPTGVVDMETWMELAPYIDSRNIYLTLGDSGALVKLAETALERAGFLRGRPNGEFDYETREAVRAFQSSLGFRADGVIGPRTWEALMQYLGGGSIQPQPPAQSYINYLVQPGDTLSSIAQRFGASVESIARINGIRNPNVIYAGQLLRIPINTGYDPREFEEQPDFAMQDEE